MARKRPHLTQRDFEVKISQTRRIWRKCTLAKHKFLFVASMDIEREHERLFNEVYDTEHIPNILAVPGVRSVVRYRNRAGEVLIGGERRALRTSDEPAYHALYELDEPEVLVSGEWARAVELGRWPEGVRPYTRNRRHRLLEQISAEGAPVPPSNR
jgi:hypothetical protein